MIRCRFIILTVAISIVYCMNTDAAEIYVPGDHATIQSAIDASVDGDIIMVGDGTWPNFRQSPLNMSGKAITLRSESGNPEHCIIDGGGWSKGIQCTHEETSATVISGFTFYRCVAFWRTSPSSSGPGDGACIYCVGSSPTIENCRFVAGNAVWHNYYGVISDGKGGGIACFDGSCPTISRCEFIDCRAAEFGGAIYVAGGMANIFDCSFLSNLVLEGDGGAIALDTSGGMIGRCTFSGNRALRGGAVMCIESVPVIGGSADLSNSFANNQSGAGADLCALRCSSVIDAGFNVFDGLMISDYWITPQQAFNLTGSQYSREPLQADVFVSPIGDDANDGLSASTPFRTIQHALSRILPDAALPLTVHLASGTYSPVTNMEIFPLPLMSHVTISGSGQERTILSPDNDSAGWVGFFETGCVIRNMTICDAKGFSGGGVSVEGGELALFDVTVRNSEAAVGAGLYLSEVTSRLVRTRIASNSPLHGMGNTGIYSSGGFLELVDSVVRSNTTETGASGISVKGNARLVNCAIDSNRCGMGGAGVDVVDGTLEMVSCRLRDNFGPTSIKINGVDGQSSFDLINCLVTGNTHIYTLAIENSTGMIRHSTFTGNGNLFSDRAVCLDASSMTARDSIFWNWCDSEFDVLEGSSLTVSYCDIRGGYPGTGNIDEDPQFASGPLSDYYLNDGLTGGTVSPCIDAGSVAAADCVYSGDWGEVNLGLMTAVSGWTADNGQVDIGYHWDHPVYSGVKLDLSQDFFRPEDIFRLDAVMLNHSGSDWNDCRLFVILDVYGSYWFAPSWITGNDGIDWYPADLATDNNHVVPVIPEFVWPEGTGSADGLMFYGAVTDPAITQIMGNLDVVMFGYGD